MVQNPAIIVTKIPFVLQARFFLTIDLKVWYTLSTTILYPRGTKKNV